MTLVNRTPLFGAHGVRLPNGRRAVGAPLLQRDLLFALTAYTVGVLVAVWRSRVALHWAFLARLATLAWADNAALVVRFLQHELIARRRVQQARAAPF